jgi:hypothetical protein
MNSNDDIEPAHPVLAPVEPPKSRRKDPGGPEALRRWEEEQERDLARRNRAFE